MTSSLPPEPPVGATNATDGTGTTYSTTSTAPTTPTGPTTSTGPATPTGPTTSTAPTTPTAPTTSTAPTWPTGPTWPTPPLADTFDRIRAAGVVRADRGRWVGGVCAGFAQRTGIDVALVRGLFVVLSIFGGAPLLVYGLAWLFLPQPDGRIHAQEMLRGVVSVGFIGAVIAVLTGVSIGGGVGWTGGTWGLNPGGLWVIAVVGLVIWLVTQQRRGQRPGGSGPATAAPTPWGTPGTPSQGAGTDGPPYGTVGTWPGTTGTAPGTTATPSGTTGTPSGTTGTSYGTTGTSYGTTGTSYGTTGTSYGTTGTPSGTTGTPSGTTGVPYGTMGTPYGTTGTPGGTTGTQPGTPWATSATTGWAPQPTPTAPLPVLPPAPDLARPSHGLTRATLGAAIVGGTAVAIIDRAGVDVPMPFAVGAAVVLGIVALGILAAGLSGRRSGGLAPIGWLVAVVAVNAVAIGSVNPSTGDVSWRPTSVSAAEAGLERGAGDVRIDLTDPAILTGATAADPVEIPISLGAGRIVVTVPPGTATRVDAQVGLGEINDRVTNTSQSSGPGENQQFVVGSGEVTVVVTAKLGLGEILVVPQGTTVAHGPISPTAPTTQNSPTTLAQEALR